MRAQPGQSNAQLTQLLRDFARAKEKLELLTGERGADSRPLSAVRRSELLPLAQLANPMKSKPVSGTPSAADYNALQADVAAIYGAIAVISNILGNARIPEA